jgi:hypothetical protein
MKAEALILALPTNIKDFVRHLAYASPLRRWFLHRQCYNFQPAQLAFLCECIDRTRHIDFPIVEIGCFQGRTTVFLNMHMNAKHIEKPYIGIDTFSGFTEADIRHETESRGKHASRFTGFRSNRKEWFDWTMEINEIARVRAIAADVNEFDFRNFRGISFALIDVDLYRPMKRSLEEVYDLLPSGGIIVADDCAQGQIFDGANQAYHEFVASVGLTPRVVLDKLGVIEKP